MQSATNQEGELSHKVLVCDDAAFMRMVIKRVLSGTEFEVIAEAENGVDAFEQYKEHSPDVVTMDLVMPEKNGVEAVRAIIGHDPDARIVMCSAVGQEEMVAEAVGAGAKGFVIKPFDGPTLLEGVKRALDG